MRKLLYTFAAFASMLAVAASCQRETPVGSTPDGDLIDVSMNFTVDDGRPATKAIGDGTTASKLAFYAYDEHGNFLPDLKPTSGYETLSDKRGTVNLKVVKGMYYKFVFIAYSATAIPDLATANENDYFAIDPASKTLTVRYDKIHTAQNEASDLFYIEVDHKFDASGDSKSVILKRVMAQLNVGSLAADMEVVANSGVDIDALKTGYKLTAIPNALNLLDGTVTGEGEITLNPAPRPSGNLSVSGSTETYAWVSTAYVLVDPAGKNTDVTLNVNMTNNSGQALTSISRSITAVPLKQNYRTNILGNIFSIDAVFNVEVSSNFNTPDNNVDYVAVNNVTSLNIQLSDNKANDVDQSYTVSTVNDNSGSSTGTSTIEIPTGTKAESLTFQLGTIESGVTEIIVKDEDASAGEYAKTVTVEVPAGADLSTITFTVETPSAHVVIKSGGNIIHELNAATGGNTLVVAEGTKIEKLVVKEGKVQIEKGGKVTSIVQDGSNDGKTYVYVEEFTGWTNLLGERSTELIPIVCGLEITPEDVVFPYDATKTAHDNATAFKAFAIDAVNKDKEILVPEGEYCFTGVDESRFGTATYGYNYNFSFTGLGDPEKVVFKSSAYHAFCFDTDESGHTASLTNLTLEGVNGGRCPLYIKHELTVNLNNIYIKQGTRSNSQAIEIDNASVYSDNRNPSDTATVNASGIHLEKDGFVGLTANPQVAADVVSYIKFNYDSDCENLSDDKFMASGKSNHGDNLFVNGVLLPIQVAKGVTTDGKGNYTVSNETGAVAAALDAITADTENKNPVITITEDTDFSYPARKEYGNDETQTITIDGGGKILRFHGTDTDWSSVGAKEGNLIIKNATIYKDEPGNGAWNNHALILSGNVVVENVTFHNSVAVSETASFENVDFIETGDYYTAIVKASCSEVSFKNCSFTTNEENGRGIKVMDQYVDEAQRKQVKISVSDCSFATAKKAAILVTNTKGAKIIWGDGNDISNVTADKVNAVWNDSSRTAAWDLVEVSGCTKKQE